jgi:hypothetical protein
LQYVSKKRPAEEQPQKEVPQAVDEEKGEEE